MQIHVEVTKTAEKTVVTIEIAPPLSEQQRELAARLLLKEFGRVLTFVGYRQHSTDEGPVGRFTYTAGLPHYERWKQRTGDFYTRVCRVFGPV